MPAMWMDVDAALAAVPVNLVALIDDADFKSREESVTYDQAGMDLVWNFVTTGGAYTQTAVTPTTSGVYDWTNKGNGMYSIEIPASGGGSINNDTEGFGWFTGFATGILPWTGPVIGFRAAGLNDKLCNWLYSPYRGLAGTALPNANADAAFGLPTSDAGGLDMDNDVNNQLVANRLDHLLLTSTGVASGGDLGAFVAENTIFAHVMSSSSGGAATIGDYDNATDSLEALSDKTILGLSATAVGNLEDQYDGTGLTGDNFPATQSQVGSLTSGSGGLSTVASSFVLTTGTQSSGTVSDTEQLNGTVHTIVPAAIIDCYYEFDVGVNGAATEAHWDGYVGNNGDTVQVHGYDWVSTSFKQIGTIDGKNANSNEEHAFILTNAMTGTGANAGLVRVRFESSGGTVAVDLNTDRILCEYTSVAAERTILHSGTAQAGSTNTITLDSGASAIDHFYAHARVLIAGGTGSEQERIIVDYTGSSKVAKVAPPWSTNPDSTSVFDIIPGTVHAETDSRTVKVGLVAAASASSVTLDSTASAVNEFYLNDAVSIDSGTGEGQQRIIIAYNGTTKVATIVPDWTTNPDVTSEYIVEEVLVVADVLAISHDETAADNLELDYDGTGYAKANSTIGNVTLVTTTTTNTDMVGTDGANTTVPDAAGVAASLHSTTDGLIADVPTVAEFNARTLLAASYFDASTDTVTSDAASRTASKATGFSTHDAAAVKTAIEAGGSHLALIKAVTDALNNLSAADVLTQVNAALDAAIAELSVAAPAATPTLRTGLMLLYMALRNKLVVQTSGTDALEIHNDAGTKIASKAITDDGSDYTEAEMS